MNISVVICTCNGEKYIGDQLKSIVSQTLPPNEIIICDDDSEDNTLEIAEKVLTSFEGKIVIRKNSERVGVAKNFINGYRLASGEYIFSCDQDDVWRPNKIEIFFDAFQSSHKELYFSNGLVVDENLHSLGFTTWDRVKFSKHMESDLLDILLKRDIVTGAEMAVSKKLVEKIFDMPSEYYLHDEWLALNAALANSIEAIDSDTFMYRQHGNNVAGMKANEKGLVDGIKIWVQNCRTLKSSYYRNFMRFSLLQRNAKSSGIESDKLDKCILFWEGLYDLGQYSKKKSIVYCLRNYFNGNYNRYFVGIRGALRDVICIIAGLNEGVIECED